MGFLPRLAARVLLVALLTFAAPAQAWVSKLDKGVYPSAIASDSAGNVVVVGVRSIGSSRWFYVARYREDGALSWRAEEPTVINDALWYGANAVAVDAIGDVYVTGGAAFDGAPSFLVARYEGGTGRPLWKTYISRVGTEAVTEGSGVSIALGRRGDLFASGKVYRRGPTGVVALLNADDGAIQWIREVDYHAADVSVDASGDVLTAESQVMKLAAETGRTLWRSDLAVPRSRRVHIYSVVANGRGDVVGAGIVGSASWDTWAFYAVGISGSTGALKWEMAGKSADEPGYVSSMRVGPRGDVYLGGNDRGQPMLLRLHPSTGREDWIRRPWHRKSYASSSEVTDIFVDRTGVYACGTTGLPRFMLAAYTPEGRRRWRQDLGRGYPSAMTGGGGRLYVAGFDYSRGFVLVGLSAKDGAPL